MLTKSGSHNCLKTISLSECLLLMACHALQQSGHSLREKVSPADAGWHFNRINLTETSLGIEKTGLHWLHLCVLKPGIVRPKIMIDTGGLKSNFLGAPESKLVKQENHNLLIQIV